MKKTAATPDDIQTLILFWAALPENNYSLYHYVIENYERTTIKAEICNTFPEYSLFGTEWMDSSLMDILT